MRDVKDIKRLVEFNYMEEEGKDDFQGSKFGKSLDFLSLFGYLFLVAELLFWICGSYFSWDAGIEELSWKLSWPKGCEGMEREGL